MNEPALPFISAIVIGLGATLTFDIWGHVQPIPFDVQIPEAGRLYAAYNEGAAKNGVRPISNVRFGNLLGERGSARRARTAATVSCSAASTCWSE